MVPLTKGNRSEKETHFCDFPRDVPRPDPVGPQGVRGSRGDSGAGEVFCSPRLLSARTEDTSRGSSQVRRRLA